MRIAIVDDEMDVQASLEKTLQTWAGRNRLDISCDYFPTGGEFLSALSGKQYDVVFMDIYMDGSDGIQTAVRMRQVSPGCCLIFLTSSEEHMMQAFPCHAFDYLLKPLDEARLTQTLTDLLRVSPDKQPYFDLSQGKQTIHVLYSHLQYISADSNYCIVQAKEQYRCRMPFHKLKTLLADDERFCVINRGILVNLDYVDDMEDYTCRMRNGVSFPINTKKKTELKQALITYRFNIRRRRLSRR